MATEKTHRRDPASDFYVHLKSNSFLNDKNKKVHKKLILL